MKTARAVRIWRELHASTTCTTSGLASTITRENLNNYRLYANERTGCISEIFTRYLCMCETTKENDACSLHLRQSHWVAITKQSPGARYHATPSGGLYYKSGALFRCWSPGLVQRFPNGLLDSASWYENECSGNSAQQTTSLLASPWSIRSLRQSFLYIRIILELSRVIFTHVTI